MIQVRVKTIGTGPRGPGKGDDDYGNQTFKNK
jgi:hypothetical protein